MWTSPSVFFTLQVPQRPRCSPRIEARPLCHRQHGVGLGAGGGDFALREDDLGNRAFRRGHIGDHRGIGLGPDRGTEAFLM